MYLPNGLTEAYTQALERVDWNRIASYLRIEDLPKNEPDKQVEGLGETALENTIIRWDVQSRPQGADIFWRVVSKTPEVKSTNLTKPPNRWIFVALPMKLLEMCASFCAAKRTATCHKKKSTTSAWSSTKRRFQRSLGW